jgi:hypothetical protein
MILFPTDGPNLGFHNKKQADPCWHGTSETLYCDFCTKKMLLPVLGENYAPVQSKCMPEVGAYDRIA